MFPVWMLAFLLVMATLVWVAVVLGLPQPFVGLAVGVLVAAAVIAAVAVIRRQRRPKGPRR